MADRTVTVKSSGGDYTSLNAALSGESTDLVSNTRVLTIECYAMEDTAVADTGTGYTVSSGYYIKLIVPTAERHDGKYNTGKYRLNVAQEWYGALTLQESYTQVIGLQIRCNWTTNANTSSALYISEASGSGYLLDSVICIQRNTGSFQALNTRAGLTARNSVFIGAGDGASVVDPVTTTWQNCTFVSGDEGFVAWYGTNNFTNCFFRGGTADLNSGGNWSLTTCATTDGATRTGVATGLRSVAYTTATFVGVTDGSEDLHLVSGSALIDQGTDLSGTFTTDIDGQTRGTTFDIGADEYVVTLLLDQEGFRFRNDDGSESAATWKANQDTNITLAADTAARLRMLVNATGDPASKNYQLEYRHKPSGGSFGSWKKVIPTQ